MFSNNAMKKSDYGNQIFVSEIINWNFYNTGVIRFGKAHHNLV